MSGGFLGSLLSVLVGPLTEVAVPLAKNNFAQLGITATAPAIHVGIHAGIQKKIHRSGTATLRFPNKEMNDIMKIVQALEDCNILMKGITETIENETKEQKGRFLRMLLSTLGVSLFENMLTGKGMLRVGYGNEKGKEVLRTGYGSKEGNGVLRAGFGNKTLFHPIL